MPDILLVRSLLRRLFSASALLALFMAAPIMAVAANNDKAEAAKGDLEQVKEKIQQLANAIKASQLAKQDANEALKASEIAISASRKKLREIQDAQQENRGKLQDLQKQMSLL
jgi:murein hydrolase activator